MQELRQPGIAPAHAPHVVVKALVCGALDPFGRSGDGMQQLALFIV
jgi:hypothetical protein